MTDSKPSLLCPAGFPVPPGTSEWSLIPGPKGDKGEPGMPPRQRRAIVYLFVVAVLIAVAIGFLVVHQINVNNHKWCQTISTLTAQRPPSGPAAANPSRAYEQKLYADFRDLRRQLGCG